MQNVTQIAVAGYGLVGKRHAEAILRNRRLALAAVVESDEMRRLEAAILDVPVFASLSEMLAGTSPDGTVLATPTPKHVEHGLICVSHKCPVLIEKPIAVSAKESRKLLDSASAAGVPILVGHHRRYNGVVRAAKQSISEGAIGDIRSVQATCWLYKPDHYFRSAPWRAKRGAGPVSVNLVHDVDLLRHFCGEVTAVQATAVPSVRGFENEDLASAVLTFRSGAVATISVSDAIASPWSWELTARENPVYPETNESCYLIGGSRGSLSLPDLRLWRHAGEPDWWTPISATTIDHEPGDPMAAQLDHFADVIHGISKPLVSGSEGLRSLELVEAIALSASTRSLVTIGSLQRQ